VKILVVDDDLELLHLIGFTLRAAGYLIVEATDGPSAIRAYETERPDLVVLDVNLPHLSGLEVLRRIRGGESPAPVMMLTVRSSEEDQVRALDLGADDYLTKPFSPRTLTARVRALLRRAGEHERPTPLVAGPFSLDPEMQTVSLSGGAAVRLTPLEFRLLQLMVANAGRPVTMERITAHVWGYRGMGDRQLLKQLVHRLRQKIERDPAQPQHLVNLSGVGYVLQIGGD
jgi:DNA-binding response OmpR family regulator